MEGSRATRNTESVTCRPRPGDRAVRCGGGSDGDHLDEIAQLLALAIARSRQRRDSALPPTAHGHFGLDCKPDQSVCVDPFG